VRAACRAEPGASLKCIQGRLMSFAAADPPGRCTRGRLDFTNRDATSSRAPERVLGHKVMHHHQFRSLPSVIELDRTYAQNSGRQSIHFCETLATW